MNQSALYKMQNESFERVARPDSDPIFVSVRAGNAACPAIDMSAATDAAKKLRTTIEELDGACG